MLELCTCQVYESFARFKRRAGGLRHEESRESVHRLSWANGSAGIIHFQVFCHASEQI